MWTCCVARLPASHQFSFFAPHPIPAHACLESSASLPSGQCLAALVAGLGEPRAWLETRGTNPGAQPANLVVTLQAACL